ncbi:hypothetical protein ACOMHN_004889 [Nucella lapillus]
MFADDMHTDHPGDADSLWPAEMCDTELAEEELGGVSPSLVPTGAVTPSQRSEYTEVIVTVPGLVLVTVTVPGLVLVIVTVPGLVLVIVTVPGLVLVIVTVPGLVLVIVTVPGLVLVIVTVPGLVLVIVTVPGLVLVIVTVPGASDCERSVSSGEIVPRPHRQHGG